jgi:hypothetical protein
VERESFRSLWEDEITGCVAEHQRRTAGIVKELNDAGKCERTGPALDRTDQHGHWNSHYSAAQDHPRNMEFLVGMAEDMEARTSKGMTVLDVAVMTGMYSYWEDCGTKKSHNSQSRSLEMCRLRFERHSTIVRQIQPTQESQSI